MLMRINEDIVGKTSNNSSIAGKRQLTQIYTGQRQNKEVFFDTKISHFNDEATLKEAKRNSSVCFNFEDKEHLVPHQFGKQADSNLLIQNLKPHQLQRQSHSILKDTGIQILSPKSNQNSAQSPHANSASASNKALRNIQATQKHLSNISKLNSLMTMSGANKDGISSKQYVVNDVGRQVLSNLVKDKIKTKASRSAFDNSKTLKAEEHSIIKDSARFSKQPPSKQGSRLFSGDDGSVRSRSRRGNTMIRTGLLSDKSKDAMSQSDDQVEEIFKQTDQKVQFFKAAKEFQNVVRKGQTKTAKSISQDFLKHLQEQHVIPVPILVRLEKQVLNLIGYQLNDGLAISLGKTLSQISSKDVKRHVSEAYLDGNNIKDQSLAVILKGLFEQSHLKKFQCSNNEIGASSLEYLDSILTKKKPKQENVCLLYNCFSNLQELELYNLKAQGFIVDKIIQTITSSDLLQVCKLSSINLSDSKIQQSLSIMVRRSENLKELELSWASILPAQMEVLGKDFEQNKTLRFLNLSWNNLEDSNPSSGKFLDSLAVFIKHNHNLLHLELSGMNIRKNIEKLIKPIKLSTSLQSVHLSSNQIQSFYIDRLVEELNIISNKAQKIDHDFLLQHGTLNMGQSSLSVLEHEEDFSDADSETIIHLQESKVINNHILAKINQQKQYNQGSKKQSLLNSQLEGPLTLNRVIDHHELAWNKSFHQGFKSLIDAHCLNLHSFKYAETWKMTNSHSDCWICEKHKYVIIFYKQSHAVNSFKILNKDRAAPIDQRNAALLDHLTDPLLKTSPVYGRFIHRPLLSGTFNDWHYNQLIRVHEFAMLLDKKLLSHHTQVEDPFRIIQSLQMEDSIIDDYKKRWRQILRNNLKYEKDTLYLNMPKMNDADFDDQVGQDLFVFAGWMRPGKQTMVIRDFELNCYFHKNFAVELRKHEIIGSQVAVAVVKKKRNRVFKKETSVFKEWKEDTQNSLEKMFENDIQCWKVARFVKSPEEEQEICRLLRSSFSEVKKVFIHYASNSSYPTISMIDFSQVCSAMNLLDKHVNLSTIDRLFIATNVELVEMDENPDKELCRFEMLEILVRIAGVKFKDTGVAKHYSDALKMLLDNHLLPHSVTIKGQSFRDDELWTLDVNDTLEANLEGLKKVFNRFGKVNRGFLNVKETLQMMRACHCDLTDKEITHCYGMSKMSVINEANQSKSYTKLQFVEMLEFIGRIAEMWVKDDSLQLYEKINRVLDSILSIIGIQRKPPIIYKEESD